jgi:SAM-dependent methyltransferase
VVPGVKQIEKVNLGCGPSAPVNWLNVDGSWNAWLSNHKGLRQALKVFGIIGRDIPGANWSVRPLVHDLAKPLPFGDDSVSAIYGAHVLEHLYLNDARKLLSECQRVLRKGGVLRLVVPDLHAMTESYLNKKNGCGIHSSHNCLPADELNEKLGFRSAAAPSGNIFFRLYSVWKDFHHHKWMYDADSLRSYMERAGFEEVREKRYLESEIPGIEEVEQASRVVEGAGICVEGKKPGGLAN